MKQRRAADYEALLAAGRWFGSLPEDFRRELLTAGTLLELTPGQRVFSRGDASSGIFGTIQGAVRASGTNDDGSEAVLMMIGPPSWFGEVSAFDRQPRTHDASAETEALVVHVPQEALERILSADPSRWRDFALLLTHHLRLAFVAMEDTALLPIKPRLLRRLVLIAEGHGEWLDRHSRVVQVSQETLGTMLAASRQTVNKLLKELEADGLVRLGYGGVEIVDLPGLRRAALSAS